ncbi:MAG TPA: hypothetical protein P5572_22190 [Phycisphaerae bacterium]|nr:hypothetical protein [Phycisphaerales bacterium]HRX87747.1 hypothetical protein [Phycisphaerae bacterium]
MPQRSPRLFGIVLLTLTVLAMAVPALAYKPYRVYTHDQAQQAMRVAQLECKPLVLHFVPTAAQVDEQIRAYYSIRSPISRYDLDRVIVVVIPRDRYPDFADSMGIDDAGGLRTVSPYALNGTDRFSLTTARMTVEMRRGVI